MSAGATVSQEDVVLRAAMRAKATPINDDYRSAMRAKLTRHAAVGAAGVLSAVLSFIAMHHLASAVGRLWWLLAAAAMLATGLRELIDLMDLVVGDTFEPSPTARSLTSVDRAVGRLAKALGGPLRAKESPAEPESVWIVPIDRGA
jgi:hypothetical protein